MTTFKEKTNAVIPQPDREHVLVDTVSYVDHQAKISAEQEEVFEEFVVALCEMQDDADEPVDDNKKWVDRILKLRKRFKVQPRKAQMKALYDRMLANGALLEPNLSLEQYLTTKASRSLSGVLVISVLMSPYPQYVDPVTGRVRQQRFTCSANCYYCPNEPGMPRSYLSTEAAVARATRVDFDPIDQFYCRARTLLKLGHDVDKIELLVLGGTFCQFPDDYSLSFIRDLYWAANTFYDGISDFKSKRPRKSLSEEIKIHEMASKARIIGLTLETRPDTIRDFKTIAKMRAYGVTRLQVGVQHTDDGVLQHINRGCKHSDSVRAVRLLKNAGYKIDIHLMPNLPGSSPEMDAAMFEQMLVDEQMQCDQWKVYPCQTVDFTLIKQWYEQGTYVPYSLEKLMDVVVQLKSTIHPWIRLNRIFRALPAQHITSGITMTNFREHMYARMETQGAKCSCIRCREVGTHIRRDERAQKNRNRTSDGDETTGATETLREKLSREPVLRRRKYKSSGGDEVFISIESEDESILMGFVRLRCPPQWIAPADREQLGMHPHEAFLDQFTLPPDGKYGTEAEYAELHATFPELYRAALVREAHVYGAKQKKKAGKDAKKGLWGQKLGSSKKGEDAAKNEIREKQMLTAQSKGYGSMMMAEAEKIAKKNGYQRVAVIAGVGTKGYYRRVLGYKSGGTYMVKDLDTVHVGLDGAGEVDEENVKNMKRALGATVVIMLANYTVFWSLSVVASIVMAGLYMLCLDYLHFVRVHYGNNVNRGLLQLSRMGLLLMNCCVVLKMLSAFAPGVMDMVFVVLKMLSAFAPGVMDMVLPPRADGCNCGMLWPSTLALYVAGFYILKMVLVKRMVLLLQNPMFGNDTGVRAVAEQTGSLLFTQICAFALCEFLVLNHTSSTCTAGATEGYDSTTMLQCHDKFDALCIWTAIAAIAADLMMFTSFCRHWYGVLLVLMEEVAVVLQWQCCLVCLCMCSCVVDACFHLSLLYTNVDEEFDAMQGTFAFLLDACVIATACTLSFSDSVDYVIRMFGKEGSEIHVKLESIRDRLHIM